MGKYLDLIKEEATTLLQNKKTLINILVLGILILGLWLGVDLARREQILKSRATNPPIAFTGDNVKQSGNQWVVLDASKPITLELTAPVFEGGSSTGSQGSSACKTQEEVAAAALQQFPIVKTQILKDIGWPESTSNLQIVNKWIEIAPQSDTNAQKVKKDLQDAESCKTADSGNSISKFLSEGLVGTVYAGHTCPSPEFRFCADGNVYQDKCYYDELAVDDPNIEDHILAEDCQGRGCENGACKSSGNPPPPPQPPPADDSWCTGKPGVVTCTDADMWPASQGSCTKNGQTCTQYYQYECTTSAGVKYCSKPASQCAEPCGGTECPAGQDKVDGGLIGQRYSDAIVNKDLQPFQPPASQSNPCGYKYYTYVSTLIDGKNVCAKPGFGAWSDQKQCPGAGQCIVSWTVSDDKPAANKDITVTVKGEKDSAGWQNVHLLLDGGQTGIIAGKIDAGPTFNYKVNSGTVGKHTLSFTTSEGKSICTPVKGFITGGGAAVPATNFRVAENPAEFSETGPYGWQDYTVDGMTADYTFTDKTPGQKSVFVDFKYSNGQNIRRTAQIRILGSGPAITGCSLSFEANNITVLNLTGTNFGSVKGTVKSGDRTLDARQWNNTSIKAVFPNAPEGEKLPVILTNTDGQESHEVQCSATMQLSLGAKVFCRTASAQDTTNVDLTLVGDFAGGTKTKQKVTIDKEGNIAGLSQKLEDGKQYKLSLKAPKSVRKTVPFTAGSGTTNIPNFVLPVGDIFPVSGGDGTINPFDKSELNRQWIIAGSGTGRTGDFNGDGRVNSIDWACMRYDFGSSDDAEPVAPAAATIDVGSTASQR